MCFRYDIISPKKLPQDSYTAKGHASWDFDLRSQLWHKSMLMWTATLNATPTQRDKSEAKL
jgi:hypothetical protein